MANWKNISEEFTPKLQKEWEDRKFSYEQTWAWINAGLQVDDAGYAYWLENIKSKDDKWLSEYLKYGDDQEI